MEATLPRKPGGHPSAVPSFGTVRGGLAPCAAGWPHDQLFDRLFPQLNAAVVIVSSAGCVLLLIAPSA